MAKIDSQTILHRAATLFAADGVNGFSIRKLAKSISISASAIYYYFTSEEALLRAMFESLNHELGVKRQALPHVETAQAMLYQRLHFQIENQDAIVAVLKYYLAFRHTFPKHSAGFVPDKSALHIEEVLERGIKTKEFTVTDVALDAKVIAHAINGFLLEYYPYSPQGDERERLVRQLHSFILRAIAT